MIRDIELVRDVMLFIELNKESFHDNFSSDQITIEGHSKEAIAYHCLVLLDAGLLLAQNTSSEDSLRLSILGISWQGHEFLDLIRDDEFWAKIKSSAAEKSIPLNAEFIVSIAGLLAGKALSEEDSTTS